MPCPNCQAPERVLFGPGRKPAELANVHLGEWISLERCPACQALWCSSLYEPYAAFEYLVRWEWDPERWRRLHAADAGETLRRWHAAIIRENWRDLDPPERALVENHRRRSQGHNPIDNLADFGSADSRRLIPPEE